MTIDEFLAAKTVQLATAGIETPRLDCLLLLEDTLIQPRASLLAHLDMPLTSEQTTQLEASITRRQKHEPLAYIRGHAAFYGRSFLVTSDVLVPRPESEQIITLLKTLSLPRNPVIADIGTGSGCLAISAALELPATQVDGYDISPVALAVARQNAAALGAHVEFYQSDLLTSLQGQYNVLLANLPYVPENSAVNQATTFEPKLALFAGSDGLDVLRVFWQQVATLAHKPDFILTESMPSQHHSMGLLARASGFALDRREGYVQVFAT